MVPPNENRVGVSVVRITSEIQMLSPEILAGLFFLAAAIACLLWPRKFYEHALRPSYRNSDINDESRQMQRSGYVWTVRIFGVVAAVMFVFIAFHFFSYTPTPVGVGRNRSASQYPATKNFGISNSGG